MNSSNHVLSEASMSTVPRQNGIQTPLTSLHFNLDQEEILKMYKITNNLITFVSTLYIIYVYNYTFMR